MPIEVYIDSMFDVQDLGSTPCLDQIPLDEPISVCGTSPSGAILASTTSVPSQVTRYSCIPSPGPRSSKVTIAQKAKKITINISLPRHQIVFRSCSLKCRPTCSSDLLENVGPVPSLTAWKHNIMSTPASGRIAKLSGVPSPYA
jgi:hypothetical protein